MFRAQIPRTHIIKRAQCTSITPGCLQQDKNQRQETPQQTAGQQTRHAQCGTAEEPPPQIGKAKSNLEPRLSTDLHSCSCGACLYLRSRFIRPTHYTHLLKSSRSSWAVRLVQAQPKIHETLSLKKEKKGGREREEEEKRSVNSECIFTHMCSCGYMCIHIYT